MAAYGKIVEILLDDDDVKDNLETNLLKDGLENIRQSGGRRAGLHDKMNKYVEVVLIAHNASTGIFFDDDEGFGDTFNRY